MGFLEHFFKKEKTQNYIIKEVILNVVATGLFIWITVWSHFANKSIKQEVGGIQSLINNWKINFITDVALTSGTNCAAGFEQAYTGNWVGTVSGCDCLGIYCHRRGVISNSLTTGSCGYNETLCGCTTVKSRSATKLIKVPLQDLICIKRA
jgi:hypothetical protein